MDEARGEGELWPSSVAGRARSSDDARYDLAGGIWLSAADDLSEDRLREVLDHEGTHHLLVTTTPYGIAQLVVESLRTVAPWEPIDEDLGQLGKILSSASWFAHEAAATYMALTGVTPRRQREFFAALPREYRAAFALFDEFFSRHDIAAPERRELCTTITGRAFQTPILRMWKRRTLSVPDRLVEYLAKPEERPTDRLLRIIAVLTEYDIDEVREWAGRYVSGAARWTLEPQTPRSLGGLRFIALPKDSNASTTAVYRELIPRYAADNGVVARRRLEWAALERVAIASAPKRVLRRESSIGRAIARDADLVTVDLNPSPRRTSVRGSVVDAGHALMHFHSPDVAEVSVLTLSADAAARDLEVLRTNGLTLVLNLLSLDPGLGKRAHSATPAPWLHTREFLVSVHGGLTALLVTLALTADIGGDLIFEAISPRETWGFLAIRRASSPWPLVVYPCLKSHLHSDLEALGLLYKLSVENDPGRFFADRIQARDLLRYYRVFTDTNLDPGLWRKREEQMADALFEAGRFTASTEA